MLVSLRVKELRKKRGWSQRELAKRAKIRQATIAALERGASPRLDTLAVLAQAFGVKVAVLIKEE
jgi:transcriptional regulator with XRE-family HTH domain